MAVRPGTKSSCPKVQHGIAKDSQGLVEPDCANDAILTFTLQGSGAGGSRIPGTRSESSRRASAAQSSHSSGGAGSVEFGTEAPLACWYSSRSWREAAISARSKRRSSWYFFFSSVRDGTSPSCRLSATFHDRFGAVRSEYLVDSRSG